MTGLKSTVAVAAAALLVAIAAPPPALAGETLAQTGMIIADIGHDIDAISNAPHTEARFVRVTPAEIPAFDAIAGVGGTVAVTIDLSASGKLISAWVASSSGRPTLDSSALRAVRESQYAPATVGGRPISGEYNVNVSFTPDR